MVTLRGRSVSSSGVGEGLGSSFGAGQLDDQIWEFISFKITQSILEQTLVILDTLTDL